MNSDFYTVNRQKILFMANELHKRGFEKLRIIPSLAPSGMYWRCSFIEEGKENNFNVSNWICKHEEENSTEEIKLTVKELADLFIKDNFEFINNCKGKDEEYTKWYLKMLQQLKKSELPFAFADWEIPKGVWKTTENNEIKTQPNEDKYYL